MESYLMTPILLSFALLLILLLNYAIYRYFVRRHESYLLATVVVVCTLTASLLAVMLLPIDIYILSKGAISAASVKLTQDSLRRVYFSLFSFLIVLGFGGVPFAFFYGEEIDNAGSDDFDEDKEPCGRTCAALKRTFVFILVVAALLFAGLFFKPGRNIYPQFRELSWVKDLLDLNHAGYGSIMFCTASLTLFGCCAWMSYSAYGLASLPFVWLRGRPSNRQLRQELEADISELRAKQRALQLKYGGRACSSSSTKMTSEDRKELKLLDKLQSMLSHHNYRLQEEEQMSARFIGCVLKMLMPFRFLVGSLFQAVSLLVFSAVLVTSLDRLLHSQCGIKCGYVLDHPRTDSGLWNPLDAVLLLLSQYFPVDFAALGLVVLYIFGASIYSILTLGIRLVWVAPTAYAIKPRRTIPQALLLLCFILIHILMALSVMLVTLAPHYTTYGTQAFYPENGSDPLSCYEASLAKKEIPGSAHCRMSIIATVFSGVSLGIPLLSIGYYLTNWGFIAVFVGSFFYCGFIEKPKSILYRVNEDEEDEALGLLQMGKGV